MQYLIHGSLVYDNILKFNGEFQNFLSNNNFDKINISFPLHSISLQFGGTGGNIYKTSQLLKNMGGIFNPINSDIFTHIGHDCEPFFEHWKAKNISKSLVVEYEKDSTATCFILSSKSDNQITSFYSGAMKQTLNLNKINLDSYQHILLSPENPFNTINIAKAAINKGKSIYFDPGQCLPLFIQDYPTELLLILKHMTGLFVNEYESIQLNDFLKQSLNIETIFELNNINSNLQFIINTLGSHGVKGVFKGQPFNLPVAPTNLVLDPTGCGDSFRAGFFNTYLHNQDFYDSLIKGTIVSSFIVEQIGCNIDTPSYLDIEERYLEFKKKLLI